MANSLSRKKDPRRSLLRNLATSLILYEEITTTKAKAKEVKAVVEHLIYKAKKNDLASRRLLLAYLFDKKATKKVFEVMVPRYKKTNSGFILSYKLGQRLGDSAPLVMLKLKEGEVLPPVVETKISNKKDKNANTSTDKKTGQNPVKTEKTGTKIKK